MNFAYQNTANGQLVDAVKLMAFSPEIICGPKDNIGSSSVARYTIGRTIHAVKLSWYTHFLF